MTRDHDYPPCPICGDPIDYCQGHSEVRELAAEIEAGLVRDDEMPARLAWCGITEAMLAEYMGLN